MRGTWRGNEGHMEGDEGIHGGAMRGYMEEMGYMEGVMRGPLTQTTIRMQKVSGLNISGQLWVILSKGRRWAKPDSNSDEHEVISVF